MRTSGAAHAASGSEHTDVVIRTAGSTHRDPNPLADLKGHLATSSHLLQDLLPTNMLHIPLAVAILASAASARYYLLHPQGQSEFCLAIDPCSGGDKREFSLVTAECDGGDEQKWSTRLIGDTETITWYTLAAPDRCINGNSELHPLPELSLVPQGYDKPRR